MANLARDRGRHRPAGLDPYVALVLLLSVFTVGPLLQPGYFWQAHDARHSVYFVLELDRGIQDGILYPRWQGDFAFGYGYPFFNIYGPLSSYAAELFHLLGLGLTDAVKVVFGLSVVCSGLAMYAFVKQVMGRRPGLVAAVAYMTAPYRLVDLYVRAALAESVAYVFVPLVLWGAWSALHRPRLANVLGLAFAYAALLYTHPLTALLVSLILAFFVAVLALGRVNERQPWRQMTRESALPLLGHLGHVLLPVAAGVILGLGLSALFALPAMTENRFVRVDQWYGGRYAWGGDFVEFFQLFSPRWGFGTSAPGPNDGMSYQLGAVPLVLSFFGLATLLRKHGLADSPRVRLVAFFAALAALAVLLMLGVSEPLWATLPLARLVQFPWRLLAVTVVALSVLCGSAVLGGHSRSARAGVSTLAIVVLLVLSSLPYMRVEMSEGEVSLANLMRFQQSSDEMTGSTAWVRRIPRWSSMADQFLAGMLEVSKVNFGYLYGQAGEVHARPIEVHVDGELVEYYADRPALMTFDTFYYPGWHAYLLDPETGAIGQELPIALRGELGLMTVRLPPGIGRVLLRLEDTPIRKLGTVLTWGSLGLVGVLLVGRAVVRAGPMAGFRKIKTNRARAHR